MGMLMKSSSSMLFMGEELPHPFRFLADPADRSDLPMRIANPPMIGGWMHRAAVKLSFHSFANDVKHGRLARVWLGSPCKPTTSKFDRWQLPARSDSSSLCRQPPNSPPS